MRLTVRDAVATALIAVAEAIYLLWYTGAALPGFGSPRAVAGAFVVLAWATCAGAASQDVEGFLRAPRLYLATASALGVVALVVAITVLVTADTTLLAVLAIVVGVLWAMATVRHAVAAARPRPSAGVPPRKPVGAGR